MKFLTTLSLGLALGLLTACGGRDDDHNGNTSTSAVKAIEGVLAESSQGQFQIGDVPVNVAGAQVTINGSPGSTNDLQHGMTAHANGHIYSDDHSGNAGHHGDGHNSGHNGGGSGHHGNMGGTSEHFDVTHITVSPILAGHIEEITNQTLAVAGVTAIADASTYIARSQSGHTRIAFSALQLGDPIIIFGVLQEDGTVLATRINLMPAGTALTPSFTIQGLVSELDTAAKVFQCGNYAVDYSSVTVSLRDGDPVVVSGVVADGVIRANAVSVVAVNASDTVIVSGRISGLDQDARCFTLSGGHCGSMSYLVDYSSATVDLDLATHKGNVCVEGIISKQGHSYRIKAAKVTK